MVKNVITGAVTERSFNPTDKYETAYVERRVYAAISTTRATFTTSWTTKPSEQIPIGKDTLGDDFRFVKENENVKVCSYKGSVFAVEAPLFVELEITETDPGSSRATRRPTRSSPQWLRPALRCRFRCSSNRASASRSIPVRASISSAARTDCTSEYGRYAYRPFHGHLAQLEEHPLDVRKVGGSNPSMSTIKAVSDETAFLCKWDKRKRGVPRFLFMLF